MTAYKGRNTTESETTLSHIIVYDFIDSCTSVMVISVVVIVVLK